VQDKRSNPFANLTAREHEVLRIILRELKRSEFPQRISEPELNEVDQDGKSRPTLKK
jgi:hypothetical protein